MYKIAVMGDRDSVLGFRALGLEVFPTEDPAEARRTLHRLAHNDYAVIYITEQLSAQISSEIERYKDDVTPAIILIPGKTGSLGLGSAALQSAVERAVGADIL
jgi:V/A-type H+-transporting ATPase subunit F